MPSLHSPLPSPTFTLNSGQGMCSVGDDVIISQSRAPDGRLYQPYVILRSVPSLSDSFLSKTYHYKHCTINTANSNLFYPSDSPPHPSVSTQPTQQ